MPAATIEEPPSPPAARTISVGAGPCDLERAGGAVWVTLLQENAVVRLRRTAGKLATGPTASVPGSPCWMAAAGGSLWVAPSERAELIRIDAQTGKRQGRVRLGSGAADPRVLAAFGAVWATVKTSGELVRVDPARGRVVARIAVGSEPLGLVAGGGRVWVADAGGELAALDPARNRVVKRISAATTISELVAYAGGQLWIAHDLKPTLLRVDAGSGKVVGRARAGGNPSTALVDGGFLWVPNHLVDHITRITVATGESRDFTVGQYPSSVLRVGRDIWSADYGSSQISLTRAP